MISVNGDGEATVLDSGATEFGPQIDAQAWSEGDSSPEITPPADHASWWHVAAFAGALVALAGLIVAGIIGVTRPQASASGWPPGYTNPPTPTPTAADAPIEMPPPFTMPPDVPVAHQTVDGGFIQGLMRQQITYASADRAIGAGMWVGTGPIPSTSPRRRQR